MERNMEKSPNISQRPSPEKFDFKMEDKKKARAVLLKLLKKAA